MSHEEHNDDRILMLVPRKDVLNLQELTDGGMVVFGEVGSGKTSTLSAQWERFIEDNASFGGLVITGLLPAADEEA